MTVKELTKLYKGCVIPSCGWSDDGIDDELWHFTLEANDWRNKYSNSHQTQVLMGHIINTFNAVFDNDASTVEEIWACWACVCGVIEFTERYIDIKAMAEFHRIEELWKKYKPAA